MYAKQTESGIKVFGTLPSKYQSETLNVAGGFDKLEETIHKQEGFYPLIVPPYDHEVYKLGEIYFDEAYENFVYSLIAFTPYEIAMRNWPHPEFAIRIVAPSGLIDAYPSIAIWMQLNNLPIELSEDTTTAALYMNEIKLQHQELFTMLQQAGEISVETRPEVS